MRHLPIEKRPQRTPECDPSRSKTDRKTLWHRLRWSTLQVLIRFFRGLVSFYTYKSLIYAVNLISLVSFLNDLYEVSAYNSDKVLISNVHFAENCRNNGSVLGTNCIAMDLTIKNVADWWKTQARAFLVWRSTETPCLQVSSDLSGCTYTSLITPHTWWKRWSPVFSGIAMIIFTTPSNNVIIFATRDLDHRFSVYLISWN